MMKTRIQLPLLILGMCLEICPAAFAEKTEEVTFEAMKAQRQSFNQKLIKIEGRIKDLKFVKSGSNQFATFFLTDPMNPETSLSVKLTLSKKRTVINTFTCDEGEFTMVQGKYKAWGQASYLGKLEIRESTELGCSKTAHHRKAKPVEVAKKKEAAKIDIPMPVIVRTGPQEVNQITDSKGNAVKTGNSLEPGSVVKTGANSFVQLRYPDGSKVVVGANSKLTTENGSADVQAVNLAHGRVRALITKSKSERLHFKIKTTSATMGVRGTQLFVESTPEGKTTTRVVTGHVDVAKNEAELYSGKSKPVFRNQMVEAESGSVYEVKHFDSDAYLEKLKTDEPELLELADTAQVKAAEPVATPAPTGKIEKPSKKTEEEAEWLNFRVAALGYTAKNTSTFFNGLISWNPELSFDENWGIGLDLGFGPKNSTLEFAAVLSYEFTRTIALELKGGAQTWLVSPKKTGALGGLALRIGLCDHCLIDSIVVGDDLLSQTGKTYNIGRVAIGLHF